MRSMYVTKSASFSHYIVKLTSQKIIFKYPEILYSFMYEIVDICIDDKFKYNFCHPQKLCSMYQYCLCIYNLQEN